MGNLDIEEQAGNEQLIKRNLRHLVTIFCLSVIQTCLKVVVGKSLWDWFVVPLGFVSISYFHMAGLFVFAGFLSQSRTRKFPPDLKNAEKDHRFADWYPWIATNYITLIMLWGLGFLLHLTMTN